MSAARETERRKLAHIEAALAKAVGEAEASRLMCVAGEYDAHCAAQPVEPEPLAMKVRRLRRSARGRERLERAKTLSDVRFV